MFDDVLDRKQGFLDHKKLFNIVEKFVFFQVCFSFKKGFDILFDDDNVFQTIKIVLNIVRKFVIFDSGKNFKFLPSLGFFKIDLGILFNVALDKIKAFQIIKMTFQLIRKSGIFVNRLIFWMNRNYEKILYFFPRIIIQVSRQKKF